MYPISVFWAIGPLQRTHQNSLFPSFTTVYVNKLFSLLQSLHSLGNICTLSKRICTLNFQVQFTKTTFTYSKQLSKKF